ncbi:MAG: transcription-repair coupling factor [Flavobacteriaceae bacterium]|nr:MAG: transcription-repair coupling factor [Flavobacteriaceae bacterium]
MNSLSFAPIFEGFSLHQPKLQEAFLKKKPVFLSGFEGSFYSFLLAKHVQEQGCKMLYVCQDYQEACYVLDELKAVFSEEELLFFPHSFKEPYQVDLTENANVVLRSLTLKKLNESRIIKAVVSYPDALREKVIDPKALKTSKLCLKKEQNIEIESLTELFFSYHYKHTDFVYEPGEFSIRGGIVDFFSFSEKNPTRLSFFGNQIEKIRAFDLESQLSLEELDEIDLLPNIENKEEFSLRVSLLHYFQKEDLVFVNQLENCLTTLEKYFEKAKDIFENQKGLITQVSPEKIYLPSQEFLEELQHLLVVESGISPYFLNSSSVTFKLEPQPSFRKQFPLLLDNLLELQEDGYRIFISCTSEKQIQRLKDIFIDLNAKIKFEPILSNLNHGFIDVEGKMVCYTDHQIFERYKQFNKPSGFAKKDQISLKEIQNLQIGDYVTHIDHGIGKFAGLMKIDNNGNIQETIKLVYKDKDLLYVNIHALHKISKFSTKDGTEPTLSKLGSPVWKALTQKTKAKVKTLAYDLIKLYAQRKNEKGFEFSPDTYLQVELEASFMYEDTPDQLSTTLAVKQDMESEKCMDRLICGDVGFGKTEIAIRAAFKATADSKQVVVLVPTTILAFQHYNTFKKRLSDFPVNIAYINRFKTAKEKKEILEAVALGKIDILIGTHQIVSKEVKYKDLGLLIVDEEHKFGVNVKDKLKTLKANLDTLTLTATPIPRTLQFSLMAARDLSIIKTPPANRQGVNTEIIGFSEERIRDAITFELERNGQVYFINNRIENLKEIAGMIQRLVPMAKVAIGHGQMEGKKLEDLMLAFGSGEIDVLVSTTIVESGLDVPNANTIFIGGAQNFGLADLHQMRGRVGRSNTKAFCYLICPPTSSLTNEARKRLQAIEQFSDIGSGFKIAMKDLEIRGAGNLLGAEQSGFIAEIGFEAYQNILNEAVLELRHEPEFKELYKDKEIDLNQNVQLDTDLPIQIPDDYINSTQERFLMYSQLSKIETPEDLGIFKQNLIDRFGKFPIEVETVFTGLELKWLAKKMGIEKIVLKQKTLLCYFVIHGDLGFFQSDKFHKLLLYIQNTPKFASFKQKASKESASGQVYFLRFENVQSIQDAHQRMQQLHKSIEN